MVRSDDLGILYAKNMEHFGCGVAMFQPVSAKDMCPPCVGYLDSNRVWNMIANITWPGADDQRQTNSKDGSLGVSTEDAFKPLEHAPRKMEQLGIEWRPRTSIGVRQWTVDASGQTPDVGLPAGADAHIKYKSNTNFGAILIAQKPITLTSYNDETLFQTWLRANRALLSSLHGPQLRRYGLWVVTRTYASPNCSINAWDAKDKEANMSLKAKANAMGELGGDLDYGEKLTDKDWSHYSGKEKGDTVVVFFDGIEVPSRAWWWEGVKMRVGGVGSVKETREGSPGRAESARRQSSPLGVPDYLTPDRPSEEQALLAGDLWGSETPLRRGSIASGRSVSRGRQPQPKGDESSMRSVSTPSRLSKYLAYEQQPSSPNGNAATTSPPPNRGAPCLSPTTNRFSTASTARASSESKVRDSKTPDRGTSPTAMLLRELHRKPGSPSLRTPRIPT